MGDLENKVSSWFTGYETYVVMGLTGAAGVVLWYLGWVPESVASSMIIPAVGFILMRLGVRGDATKITQELLEKVPQRSAAQAAAQIVPAVDASGAATIVQVNAAADVARASVAATLVEQAPVIAEKTAQAVAQKVSAP